MVNTQHVMGQEVIYTAVKAKLDHQYVLTELLPVK